eukprot:CAMPEP_0113493780 /NCGR_PEP_ID=MMETSP0014_2-20120614/28770_1 /TAXON_ID=2857 /ORGANISM="Nitzschia sp." /LENGTH=492 /DNA_ID=CAMNT_0000387657 /DNA_START=112 /DNA_END=1587 /DNA_ORIENTATION=- /assembly_acc=CAM_ASM_000159
MSSSAVAAAADAVFPMDVPSSMAEMSPMTTVVTADADSSSSAARKRRREKLASQRVTQTTPEPALEGFYDNDQHLVSVSSSAGAAEDAAALLDATLLDDILPLPLTVGSSSVDGINAVVGGMEMEELLPALPSSSSLPKRRRVSDCLGTTSTATTAAATTKMTTTATAVVTTMTTTNKNKKPQMKYDPPPEVAATMTKEEAALWRREQRRKRNRESAAASRQRQRNRITELETELAGWKTKVQSVLDRIAALETAAANGGTVALNQTTAAMPLPDVPVSHQPEETIRQEQQHEGQQNNTDEMAAMEADALAAEQLLDVVLPVPPVAVLTIDVPSSSFVSPPASPGRDSPTSSTTCSLSSSSSTDVEETTDKVTGTEFAAQQQQRAGRNGNDGTNKVSEHSDKMISRHAVKISPNVPTFPSLQSTGSKFCPSDSNPAALLSANSSTTTTTAMTVPDRCSSSAAAAPAAKKGKGAAASSAKLDPIDSSLFSLKN